MVLGMGSSSVPKLKFSTRMVHRMEIDDMGRMKTGYLGKIIYISSEGTILFSIIHSFSLFVELIVTASNSNEYQTSHSAQGLKTTNSYLKIYGKKFRRDSYNLDP